MSPFNFKDYKKYLNKVVSQTSLKKVDLARAANCHRPLVSQVLNGAQHFTLDQIMGIASLLNLNGSESDYLYYLVAIARSSNRKSTEYYQSKIDTLQKEQNNLKKRLNVSQEEKEKDTKTLEKYYSDFYFQLIHMCTTLKTKVTLPKLKNFFNLPESSIKDYLDQLVSMGLIENKGGEYVPLENNLHISKEEPLNFINHRLAREQAIHFAKLNQDESINYSSVYTLNRDDFEELKEISIRFLKRTRKIVSQSNDENTVVIFNLDLTPVAFLKH